ncbi:hypothetical protein [Plantactinospora sp. CA-290183]|uniref:hypothetical protein n=1 Tax=Plantactinospora sp. CA-290183 TaxID=3240006 RepID=UPI003D8ECD02
MSFEQLMEHAHALQQKAIEKEVKQFKDAVESEGQGNMDRYVEDQRQRSTQTYAGVPGIFQPFTEMPKPETFDGMINHLATVMRKLSKGQSEDAINGQLYPANSTLDELSGAGAWLANWTGEAASEFKANFVDKFPSVVANQFLLASVLKGALEAEREIWVRARADIDKIAHDGLEALEGAGGCGRNDWKMRFTVVAAVVALAAVPVTGGASLLAITAVGSAASVAAEASADPPPEMRFSGESAYAVIQQVSEAATKLVEYINQQEQKIAVAMKSAQSVVGASRSSFVSARPQLAEADARNVTSGDYMGYSR